MKKLIIVLMLVFAGSVTAQWTYQGNFPDDTYLGSGHGIAVDPDGKIWHAMYYALDGDSILCTDGEWRNVRVVRVWEPDGTPAAFSPIFFAIGNGINDTIGWHFEGYSNRGMKADHEGNIINCSWHTYYKFNYQTGEAMAKYPVTEVTSSIAPAIAKNTGNVITGPVLPGMIYEEWTSDGTLLGTAIEAADVVSYARTVEVSADGNTIYAPRYTRKNIYIFTRPDEFSAFALSDSIYGFACESMVWHPVTGNLWASAGSYNDLPVPGMGLTPGTHYELDVNVDAVGKVTATVTDSIKWSFNTPENANERNRGIAFSPDGNTAYVTCFGGNDYPAIQKFTKDGTGVWQPAGIIDGYTLSQNYPNPFNPTTTIRYSVGLPGMTTLKVFDLTGREVTELVNEHRAEGTYEVEFDATDLPSGTYIYELRSRHKVLTNRLTVAK